MEHAPITLQVMPADGSLQTFSIPWVGQNIRDILESTYNLTQKHQTFSFALDYYGTYQPGSDQLGYLVVMVCGTYDLPTQRRYWELLINGKPAQKGVDWLYPMPGTNVALRNVLYSEEQHRGTTLEIKHLASSASQKS